MRILFLNTVSGFFGGVEQYIALTARGLKQRGHQCFCAAPEQSGRNQEEFDASFDEVFDLGAMSLKTAAESSRCDVVFVHKYHDIEEVLSLPSSTAAVRMFHDHDIYCPRRHKYYAVTRRICTRRAGAVCWLDLAFLERGPEGIRWASVGKKLKELKKNRRLAASVAGSTFMKEQLVINGFDPASVHVIHPCCIPPEKSPVPLPEAPSILFAGQLIRGKGADVLIRAHALLMQQTGTPIPLTLAGTGNDMEYLKQLSASLQTREYVQFAGWVNNRDLTDYYDSASVTAVPSRWPEPFGMVGVEAMLRSRPVIASRAGGISEWLEDGKTGFLVNPGDAEDLAEKLKLLTGNPELAKNMGASGLQRAQTLFSYERFIDTIESLLEEVSG